VRKHTHNFELVAMAGQRSVRQTIIPEKTGSQKPSFLEVLQPISICFCIIEKFMDICSLIIKQQII